MSLQSPNREETRWMNAVKRLGCIVCRVMGTFGTPCEVHHILKNGRRVSHLQSIGLCPAHHRAGVNASWAVSRHPWRREFEARYGSEQRLLEETRELVNLKEYA